MQIAFYFFFANLFKGETMITLRILHCVKLLLKLVSILHFNIKMLNACKFLHTNYDVSHVRIFLKDEYSFIIFKVILTCGTVSANLV